MLISYRRQEVLFNQVAKRNLVPPLRAFQSVRASSAAFALSAELRLARHYRAAVCKVSAPAAIGLYCAALQQVEHQPR